MTSKTLLSALMLVLCSLLVVADWDSYQTCEVNEPCSIIAFSVNTSLTVTISLITGNGDIFTRPTQFLNNSDCFISVFNSSNFSQYLIFNASMDQLNATGYLHNYTVKLNQTGFYPSWGRGL